MFHLSYLYCMDDYLIIRKYNELQGHKYTCRIGRNRESNSSRFVQILWLLNSASSFHHKNLYNLCSLHAFGPDILSIHRCCKYPKGISFVLNFGIFWKLLKKLKKLEIKWNLAERKLQPLQNFRYGCSLRYKQLVLNLF